MLKIVARIDTQAALKASEFAWVFASFDNHAHACDVIIKCLGAESILWRHEGENLRNYLRFFSFKATLLAEEVIKPNNYLINGMYEYEIVENWES